MLGREANVGDGHRAELREGVRAVPGGVIDSAVELGPTLLGDRIEERGLVGEMPKRRSRRHPCLSRERPHAHTLDALFVHDPIGRLNEARP